MNDHTTQGAGTPCNSDADASSNFTSQTDVVNDNAVQVVQATGVTEPIAEGDSSNANAADTTDSSTATPAATSEDAPAPATSDTAGAASGKRHRNKGKPKNNGAPPSWRVRQCADPRWEPIKAAAAAKTPIVVRAMAVDQTQPAKEGEPPKPIRTFGYKCMTENGLTAFIPMGLMPRGVKQRQVLNRKLSVMVERLELDPAKNGPELVVNRLAALKVEQKQFIASLTAGVELTEGRVMVVSENDEGYLVTVHSDGVAGPTAKAWLSKKQVKAPLTGRQRLPYAKVLQNQDGKITLTTLTQADHDERANMHREFVAALQPGVVVDGKTLVAGEHEHGYFVRILPSNPVLSPVRAWIPKRHSNEPLAVNQIVEGARVLTTEEGKLSLTLLTEEELAERQRQYEQRKAQRERQAAGNNDDRRGNRNDGNRNDGNRNGQQRNRGEHQGNGKQGGNRPRRDERTQRPAGEPASTPATTSAPTAAEPAPQQAPAKPKKPQQPRKPKTKPVNLSTDGGIKSHDLNEFGRLWKARYGNQGDAAPAAAPAAEATPTEATAPVTESNEG